MLHVGKPGNLILRHCVFTSNKNTVSDDVFWRRRCSEQFDFGLAQRLCEQFLNVGVDSNNTALTAYARSEDLIRIGAYQKNADPVLDKAVQNLPALNAFLQQKPEILCKHAEVVQQLMALPV